MYKESKEIIRYMSEAHQLAPPDHIFWMHSMLILPPKLQKYEDELVRRNQGINTRVKENRKRWTPNPVKGLCRRSKSRTWDHELWENKLFLWESYAIDWDLDPY
jgi:hypothetical protein